MVICAACQGERQRVLLNDMRHHYTKDGATQIWNYRLLECRDCGMGFVDPKPDWETLLTFYNDNYGSYDIAHVDPQREAYSLKYRIARLRYAAVDSQRLSSQLKTTAGVVAEYLTGKTVPYSLGIPLQLPKGAQILELGYGSGYWLLAMHALGYNNLYGHDIDANTQNAERLTANGITVGSGDFLESDQPLAAFDSIRLEHVFEHLSEPIAVLQKCLVLLKPGGCLVMNFPSINSWSARLSLKHCAHLELPKHLYHHTLYSAALMLKAAGFQRVRALAYAVSNNFAATYTSLKRAQGQRAIPSTMFAVFGPAYRLFSQLTHKGEFITTWAIRDS